MLISERVLVKRNGNKNLKYYESLGYDISLDEFWVEVAHLTKASKSKIIARCDFCQAEVEKCYYLYVLNISSNNLFACSKKCAKNKTIMTNLKNLGVEYIGQSEKIKNKRKQTNIQKWGVDSYAKTEEYKDRVRAHNLNKFGSEWYMQTEEFKEKSKKRNIELRGVDHNFKSKEVREKIKKTWLNNFGFDNPSKSEEVKEKKRRTSMKNFGVDNPSKSDDIKKLKSKTCLTNWGVEFPMQSKSVRDKSKQTLLDNWGVDHNMKSPEILSKMKSKNLQKWGVPYTLQSEEVRKKGLGSNLERWGDEMPTRGEKFRKKNMIIANDEFYLEYLGDNLSLFYCELGHNFEISSDNFFSRKKSNLPLCTVCNPIGNSRSIKELELFNYIKSIYSGEIIQSHRDGLEIDIYLPNLKLGFEFNGLYWHSESRKDRYYHLNKTEYFRERGIRLIHIWEDDWDNKVDIIKSQIKNWIGISDGKIFARKCKVVQLDSVSKFLNSNHIQGSDKSSIKLGLEYRGEIVSAMTFNNLEGRKKMGDGEWNLSRFCNKLGYNVIGGASKLLSHFIKEFNPIRIISYGERYWSRGDLYYKLGFNLVDITRPDYKYVVDNVRVHKSNFRKSKMKYSCTESEFTESQGIGKIWDCGKLKFEMVIS